MPQPTPPNAGAPGPGPGRGYRPAGGIPDGLLVGGLALLLGTVTLFWLATALAGLLTTGRLPHPLPFLGTPSAIRHLATSPNDLAAAWPDTPSARLPSAVAFWVTFFLLLALLTAAVLSIAISLSRLRLKARAAGPAPSAAADGGPPYGLRAPVQRPDAARGPSTGHAVGQGTSPGREERRGRPHGSRPSGAYRPARPRSAQAHRPGGQHPPGAVGAAQAPQSPQPAPPDAPPAPDAPQAAPARPHGERRGPHVTQGMPQAAEAAQARGMPQAVGTPDDPAAAPADPVATAIPRPASEPAPADGWSPGRAGNPSTGLWKAAASSASAASPPGRSPELRLRSHGGSSCLFVPAPNPAKHQLLTAALRDHRGPALVLTSATGGSALPQRAPHSRTGGLLFDPLRLLPEEDAAAAGLTRLRWAPHAGCEEAAVASARAGALLAPLRPPHRPALSARSHAQLPSHLSTAAAYDTARTLLRCWLHAAALDGRPMRQVVRWATGHQAQDAVRILRTTTSRQVAEGWGGELEAALTTHPELRESARSLVRSALAALSELHVLQACTPTSPNERLEVESFLRSGGILYVAGPASERRITPDRGSVMPLLTALVEDVVEHGRCMAARSPSGRLDPPLLCLLDDVAAVAPLPALPELLDRGGALGMPTVAVLRSPEQARARWGADAAHTLWTKAEARVLLGGADPAALGPVLDELAPDAPVPGATEALVLQQGRPPALAPLPQPDPADPAD